MTYVVIANLLNLVFLLANLTIYFRHRRLLKQASLPLKQLASRSTISVLENLINSSTEQANLDQLTYSQLAQLKRILDNSAFKRGFMRPDF